jgi:hypothetical protein
VRLAAGEEAAFRDNRIKDVSDPTEIDAGGGVEVAANSDDAKKRAEYVSSLTEGNPLFAEYHYRRGRVFLRLSKELTPAQAHKYQAALNKLKSGS